MKIDVSKVRFLSEEEGVREARLVTGKLSEYILRIFAAEVPVAWTLKQAQQVIDKLIQPEHCHHAHDCCGRFYGGQAEVFSEDYWDGAPETKVIWIKRHYHQNI